MQWLVPFLKGFFFSFQGGQSPKSPNCIKPCSIVCPLCYQLYWHMLKKLIWVRTMNREDEEKSEDHFTLFWFWIGLLSLVQPGQIQTEWLSKGITHAYIWSEFGLIGTGHFLGTISRQHFWESNYSCRMNIRAPRTEAASFRAIISAQSLMFIHIINLWRKLQL